MKTVITHDFITKRDVEFQVLEEISRIIRVADIFTLRYSEAVLAGRLKDLSIFQAKSSLEESAEYRHQVSRIRKDLAKYPFNKYDVVISTSSGPMRWIKEDIVSHNMEVPFQVAYVTNPFPGLWNFFEEEQGGALADTELTEERETDRRYAAGIDLCVTGSSRMQQLLHDIYGIEATVIAPPVSGSVFYTRPGGAEYFVTDTWLLPGYHAEILFNTFNYLKEKLIICGGGNSALLTDTVEKNILLAGFCNDIQRSHYLSNAFATIVTDTHHHNHIAFEGLRMGKPVICHRDSTVAEYIEDGVDGFIYPENTVDDLMSAIFKLLDHDFDSARIAKKFTWLGRTRFRQEFAKLLSDRTPLRQDFLRF